MWFDVITTLCYPHYPFEYISLHISSPHYFLNTTLSMSPTSTTSSGQPKKKLNLQSSHSTKMSSFHIGPSTEGPFSKSSSHILYLDSKTTLYTSKTTSVTATTLMTYTLQKSDNIPFTGWIGQRLENIMSDSCPPMLNGEILWNLVKAIEHKNFNLTVFMTVLGHGIDECLMAHLSHLGSLKPKQMSN